MTSAAFSCTSSDTEPGDYANSEGLTSQWLLQLKEASNGEGCFLAQMPTRTGRRFRASPQSLNTPLYFCLYKLMAGKKTNTQGIPYAVAGENGTVLFLSIIGLYLMEGGGEAGQLYFLSFIWLHMIGHRVALCIIKDEVWKLEFLASFGTDL